MKNINIVENPRTSLAIKEDHGKSNEHLRTSSNQSMEIICKSMNIIENEWTSMNINENHWKSTKQIGNQWKQLKYIQNDWKAYKINWKPWQILRTIEYRWKSMKTMENNESYEHQLWISTPSWTAPESTNQIQEKAIYYNVTAPAQRFQPTQDYKPLEHMTTWHYYALQNS